MWAPVLGWALLRVLAEWIESSANRHAGAVTIQAELVAASPRKTVERAASIDRFDARAVELFDQLRLRSAFGETFSFIGVEGEDAWRAAGRIRTAFLPVAPEEQTVEQDETGPWWGDADVRWLTGLHEAGGVWYFNKESYEQMVWWSALPELLKVEVDAAAEKVRLRDLAKRIEAELVLAEKAKYCLRRKQSSAPEPDETSVKAALPAANEKVASSAREEDADADLATAPLGAKEK